LKTPRIQKLLIANRGEIAVRIAKSAHALGISTVAVCSEADREAFHSSFCDQCLCIGPAAPSESYLNIDAILAAAQQSGADAIHPGYGFLSERADFAQAVMDAGLIWIGPSPSAISTMGSKTAARAAASDAGVPVVPGEHDINKAAAVGFPLLVKAVGGGGGRGMRVVESELELESALQAASREAESAFGDPALFVERYIAEGRHIEIQVFGDSHGKIVHLYERECSIQRRHQKVLEEAPSPALTPDLREKMGAAAVSVAKAVSYVGAGTVEFLLDENGSFYFLEMNTRIQVEHPVTEAITGLDLVALQIQVAQGEHLPEVEALEGAAIEVRLYAEDPGADYRPQTGSILEFSFEQDEGIRVDSGVASGSEVGIHYDPMMAKIIAYGADREQARQRLLRALNRLCLLGLKSNQQQLIEVLNSKDFIEGQVHTRWLEAQGHTENEAPPEAAIAALAVHLDGRRKALPGVCKGWRNSRFRDGLFCAGTHVLHWRPEGRGWRVKVGNSSHKVRFEPHDTGGRLWIDDQARDLAYAENDQAHYVWMGGAAHRLEKIERFPESAAQEEEDACTATTPGKVSKLAVNPGETVRAGALLIVLEAMKMEQPLFAATDGVIKAVFVAEGDQVIAGQRLVELEARE